MANKILVIARRSDACATVMSATYSASGKIVALSNRLRLAYTTCNRCYYSVTCLLSDIRTCRDSRITADTALEPSPSLVGLKQSITERANFLAGVTKAVGVYVRRGGAGGKDGGLKPKNLLFIFTWPRLSKHSGVACHVLNSTRQPSSVRQERSVKARQARSTFRSSLDYSVGLKCCFSSNRRLYSWHPACMS